MLYKYEIVSNGLVVRQGFYEDMTSPNQVARQCVEKNSNLPFKFFTVNIANENGDFWMYSVRKQDSKRKIRKLGLQELLLTKDQIDMVLSGNTTLRSIINGC